MRVPLMLFAGLALLAGPVLAQEVNLILEEPSGAIQSYKTIGMLTLCHINEDGSKECRSVPLLCGSGVVSCTATLLDQEDSEVCSLRVDKK